MFEPVLGLEPNILEAIIAVFAVVGLIEAATIVRLGRRVEAHKSQLESVKKIFVLFDQFVQAALAAGEAAHTEVKSLTKRAKLANIRADRAQRRFAKLRRKAYSRGRRAAIRAGLAPFVGRPPFEGFEGDFGNNFGPLVLQAGPGFLSNGALDNSLAAALDNSLAAALEKGLGAEAGSLVVTERYSDGEIRELKGTEAAAALRELAEARLTGHAGFTRQATETEDGKTTVVERLRVVCDEDDESNNPDAIIPGAGCATGSCAPRPNPSFDYGYGSPRAG